MSFDLDLREIFRISFLGACLFPEKTNHKRVLLKMWVVGSWFLRFNRNWHINISTLMKYVCKVKVFLRKFQAVKQQGALLGNPHDLWGINWRNSQTCTDGITKRDGELAILLHLSLHYWVLFVSKVVTALEKFSDYGSWLLLSVVSARLTKFKIFSFVIPVSKPSRSQRF